jgi:hypothetical protein
LGILHLKTLPKGFHVKKKLINNKEQVVMGITNRIKNQMAKIVLKIIQATGS